MKFSKYHIVVIGIYLALIPLLVFFFPEKIIFKPVLENNQWTIGVFIFTLLIFFLSLIWRDELRGVKINPKTLFTAFIYGTLFAFPEEILFRGIIQGFLADYI